MKTILRLAIIALTFAFTAAAPTAFAQTADNQGKGVAMSWEKAQVFVPGMFFKTTPNKVTGNKPMPVVIYLHGCTGIDPNHDVRWGEFIKGLGYIAVLPDSMARPGRKPNCDPRTKRGGAFPQAHAMRMEEFGTRLNRSRRAPGPIRTISF